ncbi:MAG: PAS domain S-box protein [Bacteroidia bacterium]|nr:PAS domain S-box protein [Bacteroidia bacterium]
MSKEVIEKTVLLDHIERRYQTIVENSLDALFLSDHNGGILEVNPAACGLFGYTEEEFKKIGRQEIINVSDPLVEEKIRERAENGKTRGILTGIKKDGTRFPLEFSSTIFKDANGEIRTCTVINDISERQKSEREIALLISNTEESFVLMDKKLIIISFNQQFEKLYKKYFNTEVKKGYSILDYAQKERKTIVESIYKKVLTGSTETSVIEVKISENERKIFQLNYKPAKDEVGSIIGVFVTATDVTEKAITEQKIIQSEKYFRALVENGSDAIAIIGIDGRVSYVSPSITKVLGYTEEEALKLNLYDMIHPDDVDHVAEKMDEVFQKPGVSIQGYTSRTKHKDGSWRWLEANITNMLHDPVINGIVDNFRDVTEKIVSEQKIIRNEKRFKALLQEGADMTAVLDMNGVYKYVSPNYPNCVGYTESELLGKNGFDFFHPEDVTKIQTEFMQIETNRRVKSSPYRYRHKNGNWYWMQSVGTNLMDDDAVSGIVLNTIDITDLIKTQQILKTSNERFEIINKATKDIIYEWDVINDVFYWADSFYSVFGYKKQDEIFKLEDWIKLTHPSDGENNKAAWNDFFADKNQTLWNKEFRFKKADDTYAYVEETGHIIRDVFGKPQRMIGLLRDVSESKYIEVQKQLQYHISQFFKTENSLHYILDNVMQYLTEFGEFRTAEIWLLSNDKQKINLFSTYAIDDIAQKYFDESKEIKQLAKGQGIPGIVWDTKKIEVWDDIESNKLFLRRKASKSGLLKSAFGLPLIYNDKFVGVLMLCGHDLLSKDKLRTDPYYSLGEFLGSEIKRKQQEEQMYLLFQSAPEILAISAPNGYFVRVNPAFCNLLGYTEEEITSTPFSTFVHPDDLKVTEKEYVETISGERNAHNFINRYRTKSGSYKWISWNSSDVFGEDGFAFAYGRDVTEIKDLEQLLENAAKMSRVGSWEFNLTKTGDDKVYWSSMTRDIMEVDRDYNPSLTRGFEFYDEESKIKIKEAERKLIETGEEFDLELLINTAKNNQRWIRCIGKSEKNKDKCTKIYGSYQDIQEHKTIQIQLQSSLKTLEDYKFALDQSAIMATTDSKGVITYANENFCKISKYSKEELIGRTHSVINSKFHSKEFFQDLWSNIKSGNVWRGEIKNRAKDGTYYWMDTTIVPFLDTENKPFQYLAIRFDITERKSADERILSIFEEKNTILESIGDAFFAVDKKFTVTYWNNIAVNLLYTPKEKIIGKNLWDVFPDGKNHSSFINYHKVINDNITIHFEEYYEPIKKWFEISAYPSSTGMSVYFKDITDRKISEETLFELNRDLLKHSKELAISNAELEQFAYVASHDLQEPLRMVTSFLTQLEKKYKDSLDAKGHQYINFAVDGAKRMRKIILDLLEFSRVGKTDDKIESIDLNEVVEEIKLLLGKQIDDKHAVVESGKLPVLQFPKSPLYQIFQNLIENALKYHQEGNKPIVVISYTETTTEWHFKIKDNGIGINQEYFDKIFIIFQRLHNKEEYSGTGMGLAITKKIIENFGGKIWVESEEGKGSTFHFKLPKTVLT